MKKTMLLTVLAGFWAFGAGGAWADGPFPTAMTDGTFGPVGSVTPNSGTGEFEIYSAINQLLGTSYTNNAQVDYLEYTGNASTWQQTGNGGYAVIGLGAYNSNTLEMYNAATPGAPVNPIGPFTGNGSYGNGSLSNPYVGTPAFFSPGTQFGLAINTVGETQLGAHTTTTPPAGTTWYSNPSYNSDGMDHMLVYYLPSLTGTVVYINDPNTNSEQPITLEDPYFVAFEDLPLNSNGANSDLDYNDLDALINGAAPFSAPVPEPVTLALFGIGLLAMAGFALRNKWIFYTKKGIFTKIGWIHM